MGPNVAGGLACRLRARDRHVCAHWSVGLGSLRSRTNQITGPRGRYTPAAPKCTRSHRSRVLDRRPRRRSRIHITIITTRTTVDNRFRATCSGESNRGVISVPNTPQYCLVGTAVSALSGHLVPGVEPLRAPGLPLASVRLERLGASRTGVVVIAELETAVRTHLVGRSAEFVLVRR
jgi:hypothetical protein